ncbi:MAG: cell wall hydrolase [Lachnospiraceae bacterium]|nr:cell wall hydrolase [Lachnospiraceae bacterium]
MKKTLLIVSRILAFVLVLSLMSGLFPVNVFSETTSEKIKKAEELKKQTEAQKNAVADKKEALEGERQILKGQLDQLNADLTEISENLEEIEGKIDVKFTEIDGAKQEVEEAKAEERAQYDFMKKRIKHIYERRDVSIIESFMTATSYADFLNKAEYVNKTEEYDQKMFAKCIELRENIEEKEAKLENEMAELNVLKEQAAAEQSKVSSIVSSTSGALANKNGAISAAELEEAAYKAELEAQEANLVALKKQLAEEQAMSRRAAQMAWRDVSELVYEETDEELLACLIYCEAGNQPYEGQVAVGAVVVNRMRSAAYPNSMVGVIYQNKQFSPVASGRLAARLATGANERCHQAARDAMNGSTPVGNCLYFRTVIPEINGQIIGGHVFY